MRNSRRPKRTERNNLYIKAKKTLLARILTALHRALNLTPPVQQTWTCHAANVLGASQYLLGGALCRYSALGQM